MSNGRMLIVAAALGVVGLLHSASTSGQNPERRIGGLDERPEIQYATRPTADRVAKLNDALARGTQTLRRDARTGYLTAVLDALGVPPESQLLVFSKTGVQRAYTSPRNPRALYFDQSVAVGYAPGAPMLELAAHDSRQGVVFYTLDQAAAPPALVRRTTCLTCHVTAGTLDVPGLIARSNHVREDGTVMPQMSSHDVDHHTSHPDRWGGWFVTSEGAPPPYQQLGHLGNVTFSGKGNTSNQVFVDWLSSAPETRGYLSPLSDIAGLLVFDHQSHAINLLTRLNWEARIGGGKVHALARELADYLLFTGETGPSAPVTPRPEFAAGLESRVPKDHLGRSFGQLDLGDRLLRYPCSYMIYSGAFEALPADVRQTVYARMIDVLSRPEPDTRRVRIKPDDRRAILEILKETKPDFPQA
jgi:hypothetical protein